VKEEIIPQFFLTRKWRKNEEYEDWNFNGSSKIEKMAHTVKEGSLRKIELHGG
jgi:hypothetical protein